jgi:hypothetical protein
MIIYTKRLLLAFSFLTLVTTNILTLTSTAFNTAVSGLVGTALGVRTVSGMLQSKLAAQGQVIKRQKATSLKRKVATRKFGSRLTSRTKRVAAKSLAAIPAESIPFIGVGVLIADTGYELYAACQSMRDLDELYSSLGVSGAVSDETSDDAIHDVCDPHLPDAGEIWSGVVGKSGEWLDQLRNSI